MSTEVHYININSVDRNWQTSNSESRYNFQVKFNQVFDPNTVFQGANINRNFKNVVSIEPVVSLIPLDAFINTFDTRLYLGVSKYPFLLLRIEELDGVFRGTHNATDKAFSTLIYDKTFFTDVLSSSYATTASYINTLTQTVTISGSSGTLFTVSADTLIFESEGFIQKIPDRKHLLRGQTPQGFRFSKIWDSYKKISEEDQSKFTDDCGILLASDPFAQIRIVEGSQENIKITDPLDLVIADELFRLKTSQVDPNSKGIDVKDRISRAWRHIPTNQTDHVWS